MKDSAAFKLLALTWGKILDTSVRGWPYSAPTPPIKIFLLPAYFSPLFASPLAPDFYVLTVCIDAPTWYIEWISSHIDTRKFILILGIDTTNRYVRYVMCMDTWIQRTHVQIQKLYFLLNNKKNRYNTMNGYYVEWIRGYGEWIHLYVESECTQLLGYFYVLFVLVWI